MVRTIAGLLTLLLVAVFSTAAEDKKDAKKVEFTTVTGDFESYKNEILTLKVENKEKKFDVPGDTLVAFSTGKKDDKIKTFKAKEHLKEVKKGAIVVVTLTPDGKKVLALGVTEPPKQKPKVEEEKKDK